MPGKLSKQGDGQLYGRTTWNRIVNFAGDRALIGNLIPVTIKYVYRNSHVGDYDPAP